MKVVAKIANKQILNNMKTSSTVAENQPKLGLGAPFGCPPTPMGLLSCNCWDFSLFFGSEDLSKVAHLGLPGSILGALWRPVS